MREWRTFYGWTLEDLAGRSGVERGTIGAMEIRDSKRSESGPALAKAFGISFEELLDDAVPPSDRLNNTRSGASDNRLTSTGYVSSDTTFFRAPVVEWARLGAELLKEAKDLQGSEWAAFVPNTTPSDLCKLVKVADDSLAPRISRGDMVAIDPSNLKPARDQVVLLRAKSDGTFLLRRFRPLAGDAFEVYGASGTVLDSERHGLEVVGVACGIKMHDI